MKDFKNQSLIQLDEATHTYKIKNAEHLRFLSVTTFIHEFFPKFESEKIAGQLSSSNSAKYGGQSQEEILQKWNDIAKEGTRTHAEIEAWIRAREAGLPEPDMSGYSAKAKYGIAWLKENIEPNWKLFPEVRIFSVNLQLAGTIDLLVWNPDLNQYLICDWKTNSQIAQTAYKGRRGIHDATKFLDDCNFSHYSLQMSLYRYLLETEYGIKINGQILLHLKEKPTYASPLGVVAYHTEYLNPNVVKMTEDRLQKKQSGELFKI